jgi:hypothetical protein
MGSFLLFDICSDHFNRELYDVTGSVFLILKEYNLTAVSI